MSIIIDLKEVASSLSLLVVEDEKELNNELVSILSLLFYSVDFAYNGVDGLERYKKTKPDIVLTDISMPKMNGIEMSRHIKDIKPTAHIIVLSAHSDTKHLIDLIDINIDQFILKPFDKNTFLFKLHKVAKKITLEKKLKKASKKKMLKAKKKNIKKS